MRKLIICVLGESYARMAVDADREADAREWAEEFADDPHDEAW
jgi:hypothetical protein